LIKGTSPLETLPKNWTTLAFGLGLGLLAYFISIFIHELGHVIGGLSMGNTFSMMTVGPFKWMKEDGRLQFQWNNNLASFGGLALTLPQQVENFKKRRLVTVGGGPFASLVFGILAWLVGISLPTSFTYGILFFKILSLISLLIFVVTIIPSKVGGFMSDGMQLLLTLRNNEQSKRYASLMHLVALNEQGILPKDLPQEIIRSGNGKEIKDIFDISFIHFQYHQSLSNNDLETAENHLDDIYENIEIYPKSFQVDLLAEILFFYTLIKPDSKKTKELIEWIGADKAASSQLVRNLLEGTKAYIRQEYPVADNHFSKVIQSSKKDGISLLYKDILRSHVKKALVS